MGSTLSTLLGGLTPYAQSIDEQPGADGQDSDPNWATPATLLNYSATAWFDAVKFQLGESPALPNFNVEVYGLEAGTAPNGYDANPGNIVIDLLTNSRYGANYPAANLDTAGSLADYEAYCNAVGFMLAPVFDTRAPGLAYVCKEFPRCKRSRTREDYPQSGAGQVAEGNSSRRSLLSFTSLSSRRLVCRARAAWARRPPRR